LSVAAVSIAVVLQGLGSLWVAGRVFDAAAVVVVMMEEGRWKLSALGAPRLIWQWQWQWWEQTIDQYQQCVFSWKQLS